MSIILDWIDQLRKWWVQYAFARELVQIILRWFLLAGSIVFSILLGAWLFPSEDGASGSVFANPTYIRYMIGPLAAFICVLLAGAVFVQDVYNLKFFRTSLHYVAASMMALISTVYPRIVIDDGKKLVVKGKTNVLDVIGGPGYMLVQPGNAVFLKFLRRPSRVVINQSTFLAPFEMIGPVINLDEHHGNIPALQTMTRDGIKVVIKDINFRYRIIHRSESSRTMDMPYPFDIDAMRRMGQNLTVNDNGVIPWSMNVQQSVGTAIREYINAMPIDDLTAPLDDKKRDPRKEFRDTVLKNTKIWAVGAQLLWVDVGHIEIVDNDVDDLRIDLWATDWIGSDNEKRAYADARRKVYRELGQAEARAEVLIRILGAIKDTDPSTTTPEERKRLFIMGVMRLLNEMKRNAPA